MNKKYMIEIKPEYEDSFQGVMLLGAKDSTLYVDTLAVENLEELNSDYINEHFGDMQDDAYQRGLDDAWEAARNISMLESDGGYSWKEMKSIFGTDSASEIYVRHTAAEAINKIKAYEEQEQKTDDEIKVGDEVAFHHDDRPDTVVVVTYIGQDGFIDGMDGRGTQYAHKNPTKWTKTGRHFDIQSILEDMRND